MSTPMKIKDTMNMVDMKVVLPVTAGYHHSACLAAGDGVGARCVGEGTCCGQLPGMHPLFSPGVFLVPAKCYMLQFVFPVSMFSLLRVTLDSFQVPPHHHSLKLNMPSALTRS